MKRQENLAIPLVLFASMLILPTIDAVALPRGARCEKLFTGGASHHATRQAELTALITDRIPDDAYKSYSTEEIAEALVTKLGDRNRRIRRSGRNSFRPSTETDLMLFFREDSVDSIIKDGFLNIHQVGHTNGDSTPSARAQLENYLTGITVESGGYGSHMRDTLIKEASRGSLEGAKISTRRRELTRKDPYNRLRPKSAYLVVRSRSIDIGNVVFRNQYGHYGAVLKEEVQPRSTWTPTDSLAASPNDIFVFDNQPVEIKAYGDKEVKYYFEAQVWGTLDLSHVAYWIVPQGTNRNSSLYQKLAATGIPIKEYGLVEDTVGRSSTRRPVVID
ncbi:MAG: hypothetical protein IPJ84_07450 [Bdellovibrionales bacterium]|nr:hypothetical protein [Bdellovibrionales bacterium]